MNGFDFSYCQIREKQGMSKEQVYKGECAMPQAFVNSCSSLTCAAVNMYTYAITLHASLCTCIPRRLYA